MYYHLFITICISIAMWFWHKLHVVLQFEFFSSSTSQLKFGDLLNPETIQLTKSLITTSVQTIRKSHKSLKILTILCLRQCIFMTVFFVSVGTDSTRTDVLYTSLNWYKNSTHHLDIQGLPPFLGHTGPSSYFLFVSSSDFWVSGIKWKYYIANVSKEFLKVL